MINKSENNKVTQLVLLLHKHIKHINLDIQ